ncbi:unnamed protein product [Microthlaspi erraticum]|uniref:Uncharacterized protein n=1 Tax=Microthlaspi erraticum TaxID=1685480 RepID=A0A6D2KZC3_9BRAS|nr:unnamed protein product [Microthlaspi erraticum]
MEPLKQALGRLRSNDSGLCSSQQELNDKIRSFEYQSQHESNTLNEEKQLIKEISKLERTRGDVIANEASRARIIESFGLKEDIQDQVKSMSSDLDGFNKERQAISERISEQSEKINASKDEIKVLEDELKIATEKRNESYSNIKVLSSPSEFRITFGCTKLYALPRFLILLPASIAMHYAVDNGSPKWIRYN